VFQGQLSVEKELFAEFLSNFKFKAIKVTNTNVPIQNDWHAKGRIFASKLYSSQMQLSVVLDVIIMPRNRGGRGGRECHRQHNPYYPRCQCAGMSRECNGSKYNIKGKI
jgi:hypothetical protein